jgi:hypothetical protein
LSQEDLLKKLAWPLAVVVVMLSGCGGSGSSQPQTPTIAPARTFELSGFRPAGLVTPNRPTTVSFTVRQPDGSPLVHYKKGPGPHTGVHLIIVRSDLSAIIHQHPPVASSGRVAQKVVFPAPGSYRVVIDVYPRLSGPLRNFQLFQTIHVKGAYRPAPLPVYASTVVVDGYRFTMQPHPPLKAIQAAFLVVTVKTPDGKPAQFTPWFGALAHAILFHKGSFAYFHTHVCAPGASGCASLLGPASVTGTSSIPGVLRVGVLVPLGGTWRLFLQCKADGHILTAPFTLKVLPA